MTRTHNPTACPRCKKANVPVYELAVPTWQQGFKMGALHLASHHCTKGGDHLRLQPSATVKRAA
jgi:putative hemolysin